MADNPLIPQIMKFTNYVQKKQPGESKNEKTKKKKKSPVKSKEVPKVLAPIPLYEV